MRPALAQDSLAQARTLQQRSQLDSAYEIITAFAEHQPNRADVQEALGDIACSRAQKIGGLGAYGSARKCKAGYGRAVALEPNNPDYLQALAEFLSQAPGMAGGDRDSAYQLAVRLRGIDENRGVSEMVNVLLRGNDREKARGDSILEATFAQRPNDPVARFVLARRLVVVHRDQRRAIDLLRPLLNTAPPQGPRTFVLGAPQYRSGQAYVQINNLDSARIMFTEALRVNPQLQQAQASLDSLTRRR